MSEGWIFTPDMGATSDQPDYDYLHYGFWLQKTTDEDGVLTYNEVQTFADSSVALSGNVADVDRQRDLQWRRGRVCTCIARSTRMAVA